MLLVVILIVLLFYAQALDYHFNKEMEWVF